MIIALSFPVTIFNNYNNRELTMKHLLQDVVYLAHTTINPSQDQDEANCEFPLPCQEAHKRLGGADFSLRSAQMMNVCGQGLQK
jgi:hypothetical protein